MRFAWGLGLAAALFGLGLLAGTCKRARDIPGQRADSVLATAPAWEDSLQAQNSLVARLKDSLRVSDAARKYWRDSARTLTRRADTAQAEIDAAVAAGVPPGVEPAAFWRDQFRAQARVAAQLRLQVIPALEATIAADSTAIRQRDGLVIELATERDQARMRVRALTREFQQYREATRPGIDLGLFRVPEWVGYVAVGGAAAGLTYVAVR